MTRVAAKKKHTRRKTGIGKDLREHVALLQMLQEAREPVRRQYLSCCSRGVCNAMSEVADNLLKGNIPLTNSQLELLRPSAKELETLAKKKTSLTKKRQILQKGGFIGALLGPAVGLLAPMVLEPLVSGLMGSILGGRK